MPQSTRTRGDPRAVVLLLPGIGNSGPAHWQSMWQMDHGFQRVQQRDWEHPHCGEWLESLEQSVAQAGPHTLLAAHSLGCLLAVHWLSHTQRRIQGVLLVAVPDPDGAQFPSQASGFSPLPTTPLPCASILVASADDPYGDLAFAQRCARSWGSRLVNLGNAGHINADSHLGDWPAGHRWLLELMPHPSP